MKVDEPGFRGEPDMPGSQEDAGQMDLSFSAAGERRRAPAPPPAAAAIEPVEPPPAAELAPPAISAIEWIMRFAYRLGVPATTLVAPFRKPSEPRIKATVDSPLPGDRAAGMALRAGHFLIGGVKMPIAQADFSPVAKLTPLVETTLHGFTWLRDLACCAPAPQCAATAEPVLTAWLDANPHPGKGIAWTVENAARRLLAWLVHAPLILGGSHDALRSDVLAAAAETAHWLERNASKADDRHGEALAWCAITAAGLLLPDGKPRRLFGEAGLVRALGEMVGEEGGVLSRGPLAQMDAIATLVDLVACYRAVRCDPPEALADALQMLVPPLLALTHADGSLGNWQGSGSVMAERIEHLVAASGVRARPLREARQWGYQRIAARGSVLVCDAAPPPLARHARTGCASTLAFEFSHGDNALIVNCGGAALAGGQIPARIEQGLRATAAHSTLVLGDANSTAVLIHGKLGAGVGEVEVDRRAVTLETGDPAMRIELGHDGYAARFGLLHRRILTLRDDGTELIGEDLLAPSGRRRMRGKVSYAIRFHLGPHVDLRLAENGRGADLLLPDGDFWRFAADSHELAAEESLWADGGGRLHPIQQLVIEGLSLRSGGSFGWSLRKLA